MNEHTVRLEAIVELAQASARNPHLRLGQLIVNALPREFGTDAFYISDVELRDALKAYPKEAE